MNKNRNERILKTGTHSFTIGVPFELFETGRRDNKKPLILYLHGYRDNINTFKKKCSELLNQIEAYHLFIQGPYPIYETRNSKKVKDWGAAWYLYDGAQEQFIQSMEKTSKFIDQILQKQKSIMNYDRVCLLGYSMGGYLAGYYSMTRTHLINELIVVSARIKTEILEKKWKLLSHLNILALHGKLDKLVDYKPQKNEIKKLKINGVSADFKLLNQKHTFNSEFVHVITDWFKEKDYKLISNFN